MVSPSEGNRARREGCRKSHISIVPLKQGNLDRRDPGEGREMLVLDPWRGLPAGSIESRYRVNATTTDSTAAGESMTGRTGCLSWARPDLWEARGVIPGPTRPVADGDRLTVRAPGDAHRRVVSL